MRKKKGKHSKYDSGATRPSVDDTKELKELEYAAASSRSNKKKKKKKKMKTWQKVLIAIIIIVLAITGIVFGYLYDKLGDIKKVELDKKELSCVDVDGYVNILLLGIDARDMDDYQACRSDAIIIASIKEETGDVTLTSVYRDTYMKMGKEDMYDKVTHAFAHGGVKGKGKGPEMSITTINQAMDLDIENFIVFNFKTVADVVDYVGGVEVDIEDYEIAELNKYTIQSAEIIGETNYNLVEHPGKQVIKGPQAVSYGRIRNGVGDDFKRTDRMRLVIEKCLEKIKKMSPAKINGLIDVITPEIRTNLSNTDILLLAKDIPEYNIKQSEGFPYEYFGGMIRGMSCVMPDELDKNVIEFHKKVFHQENYKPSAKCIEISDRIKLDAGQAGLGPANNTVPDQQIEIPDVKVEVPDGPIYEEPKEAAPQPQPEPAPQPQPEAVPDEQ